MKEADCIAFDEEARAEEWELSNAGRTRKVQAGRVLATNNGEVSARLAENGEGIALLPHFIVEDLLASGNLVPVLPDWEPTSLWLTPIIRLTRGYRCGRQILGLLREIRHPDKARLKDRSKGLSGLRATP